MMEMEIWVKPQMDEVTFAANEYVTACYERTQSPTIASSSTFAGYLANMSEYEDSFLYSATTDTYFKLEELLAGIQFDHGSNAFGPGDTAYNQGTYYGSVEFFKNMEDFDNGIRSDDVFLGASSGTGKAAPDLGEGPIGGGPSIGGDSTMFLFKTASGHFFFSNAPGWSLVSPLTGYYS